MQHEGVERDTVPIQTNLETQVTLSLTISTNSLLKHKRNVELMDIIVLLYNYECLFSQRTLYVILDWLHIDNITGQCFLSI